MKIITTILALFITLLSFGQTKNDEIKVLARLTKVGEGSKVQIAEYKVLKVLKGEVSSRTIYVAYYFYLEPKKHTEVVLTLEEHSESMTAKGYYIFPNYDAVAGIETAYSVSVDRKHWLACETGEGDCPILNFKQTAKMKDWFLTMPCGGTATTVQLYEKGKEEAIQKVLARHDECPPIFDLSELKDGLYTAHMFGCNLGGAIQFRIVTSKK